MTQDKKGKKAEREERRKKLLELRKDKVEKINIDVRERLIFLIYIQSPRGSRYEYLETRYGISARRWQNVCNRAQLPGIDMLSSILKDHPGYCTWLMLGKVISSVGQVHPCTEIQIDQTAEGLIDPTIKGWEDKLEKATWLTVIKNSPNLEKTAALLPKPDSAERS